MVLGLVGLFVHSHNIWLLNEAKDKDLSAKISDQLIFLF
ncbi:hypothetical protein NC99_11700 [Sunxiuqinia dokdonensis]|uniref:Uncharacterized protein n=1 Tax=Sunxiuqinia dokdonensis TaxID=1409788 RepID=A0A0L8VC28_9BACT|nr:hypothetical protein NC99_11700 [Sunxiuqinia dokdonensis]